jgi:CRISPR-associated exonuclease Cas4
MIYLIIFLILAGLALLWAASRQRRSAGVPAGRIIYADTRAWGAVEEPLYDPELRLTGRPDYLVRQGEYLIPIEVKTSRISGSPYDSHIFQLAAYLWLVHSHFGIRPPYGILHYANQTVAIDYTSELEAAFLALVDEIREDERRTKRGQEVNRSHHSRFRCLRCGFRSICDQALE